MRDELDSSLVAKYPKMFQNRYKSMQETAMCWGFECGDGWYNILNSLCANIQSHIDWKQEQKEKYNRGDGCPQVVVDQVKEKFGGLRFYYHGGDNVVDGMVRMAESWAACTCETCGESGTLRGGGWIRTLCDKHEEEYQRKRNEDRST